MGHHLHTSQRGHKVHHLYRGTVGQIDPPRKPNSHFWRLSPKRSGFSYRHPSRNQLLLFNRLLHKQLQSFGRCLFLLLWGWREIWFCCEQCGSTHRVWTVFDLLRQTRVTCIVCILSLYDVVGLHFTTDHRVTDFRLPLFLRNPSKACEQMQNK